MDTFYTDERNVQMVIALLKAHNIKKVIASPGTTNVTFVASIQNDPYFEIYSAVDERSAAYIACGMAAESGEPVALSCTGATASRNYFPGLTEAFYRKLPVLAITSTHRGHVGQNIAQMIDRSKQPNDIVKLSVQIPIIHDEEDAWACNVDLNRAMMELRRHGGGPVHINLTTNMSSNYCVETLPPARVIQRISYGDALPMLPLGKIVIFVGAHQQWSVALMQIVDDFCRAHDSVVLCDHTSNYRGAYRVLANIITDQKQYTSPCLNIDLLIHIGDVSGAYMNIKPKKVWRVHPDGEVRDTFKTLEYVFEMKEMDFFQNYVSDEMLTGREECSCFKQWYQERVRLESKIPELPFSNIWMAQHTARELPPDSTLYLGILNSLRAWNFFETPQSVTAYANTGGFGIDGGVSSLLGASLTDGNRLFFGITGDLAFFYDMNVLGNRHIGNNIRLMVVNNGRGTEFRNYSHRAAAFGEDADAYIAAAGHYGSQSRKLVKHYAHDLGFEYMSASDKEDYIVQVKRFLTQEVVEKPILFEVFTDSQMESDALKLMNELDASVSGIAKKVAKELLGEKGVSTLKKLVKR